VVETVDRCACRGMPGRRLLGRPARLAHRACRRARAGFVIVGAGGRGALCLGTAALAREAV